MSPDLIITDFPAHLNADGIGVTTLVEAIRATPALADTIIFNISSSGFPQIHNYAVAAGANVSISVAPDGRTIADEIKRWISAW